MTFQAYLDNIEKQTGVSAEAMVKQAVSKGLTKPGAKSRPVIDWLMAEYSLSNAYAMAIVRLLRDRCRPILNRAPHLLFPSKPEDLPMLRRIAELSAPPGFKVPIAQAHSLEDFKAAIGESLLQPEGGKRFFSAR